MDGCIMMAIDALCAVQVPPMSAEQTRRLLENNMPQPLDRIFERIDLEHCLGSATISQVPCPHHSA